MTVCILTSCNFWEVFIVVPRLVLFIVVPRLVLFIVVPRLVLFIVVPRLDQAQVTVALGGIFVVYYWGAAFNELLFGT